MLKGREEYGEGTEGKKNKTVRGREKRDGEIGEGRSEEGRKKGGMWKDKK